MLTKGIAHAKHRRGYAAQTRVGKEYRGGLRDEGVKGSRRALGFGVGSLSTGVLGETALPRFCSGEFRVLEYGKELGGRMVLCCLSMGSNYFLR